MTWWVNKIKGTPEFQTAGTVPSFTLPEVVIEDKLDRTNPVAVRNWSKKNDPIAYAVREGTDKAAREWVGPGLAALTAPITLPAAAGGLGALGEAVYGAAAPYVSAAWNASLPGLGGVPGATFGNAINAGFAAHGATNIVPDIKKFAKDPSLDTGVRVATDALELLPVVGPTVGALRAGTEAALLSTPRALKNYVAAKSLSKQLNTTPFQVKNSTLTRPQKIDLINNSTVARQNDLKQTLPPDEYEAFLEEMYLYNKQAYDNPMIAWKGWNRPSSFYDGVGNNVPKEGGLQYRLDDEGKFFKDKFCPPGSECAKSANAVTNKLYTDLTGKTFDVEGNAHNAWHMEDQMARHGGVKPWMGPDGLELKIGDRILMGNGIDQSTHVPGYTADPSVRHAATYAGIQKVGDEIVPMVLESGKNNPMYLNPIWDTFTGRDTFIKAMRARQFKGSEVGKAMVEKNLRYAYRDAPPTSTFSSQNETAQKLLTDSEFFKDVMKKSHDLTNDEFYEIVNNVIGVGAQETKLKGNLPGKPLAKAKIQVQDALNELGLTRPIKETINLGKRVANFASTLGVDSHLPPYPGASQIEMEAAKLTAKKDVSFQRAVDIVKSQYQPKKPFTLSNTAPSNGPFRQKHQTDTDMLAGIPDELKSRDAFPNAIGQMAVNFKKAQKMYPEATPRQLMDISTLMWNSPGKAKNKALVDFYLFGKGNPDPSRFNFDYVRKVNAAKDELINVHPKGQRELFEQNTRIGYPEIEYKTGGCVNCKKQ
jgi:hypothetical protein